jgi:hypothetical protein
MLISNDHLPYEERVLVVSSAVEKVDNMLLVNGVAVVVVEVLIIVVVEVFRIVEFETTFVLMRNVEFGRSYIVVMLAVEIEVLISPEEVLFDVTSF